MLRDGAARMGVDLAGNRTGILLNAKTAQQYKLRIGQEVTYQVFAYNQWYDQKVPIVGLLNYFPTLDPTQKFFIVANLDPNGAGILGQAPRIDCPVTIERLDGQLVGARIVVNLATQVLVDSGVVFHERRHSTVRKTAFRSRGCRSLPAADSRSKIACLSEGVPGEKLHLGCPGAVRLFTPQ